MFSSDFSTLPDIEEYIHLERVDSTNTYARTLKRLPRKGYAIIRADRQTAGRGQRDNSFFSSVSGGLWISFVVPISDPADHFSCNRALTLAIIKALECCSGGKAPLRIKWPNDIYWGGRKCCGILLESMPRHPTHLISGFGLNVNIPAEVFPEQLQSIATSALIETGTTLPLDSVLRHIIFEFGHYRTANPADTHEQYRRLLYRRGDRVSVGKHTGIFSDVLPDGRLRLDTPLGPEYCVSGVLRYLI